MKANIKSRKIVQFMCYCCVPSDAPQNKILTTIPQSTMVKNNIHRKEDLMQKLICIPIEQYNLMLEAYDDVVAELEEMKRALAEVTHSHKAK